MDYPRFKTTGGREFLRVSFNTTTLSKEEFQSLRLVLREAGGRFSPFDKTWVIQAEQEDYFEGLLAGLTFTPPLRTNTTPGESPWDRKHETEIQNRLYFQQREREQRKEEEKIPFNFRMDTIAGTAFRLRVFQRVGDQEHVDQHRKLIEEAEAYWREKLDGSLPRWWNWALKG